MMNRIKSGAVAVWWVLISCAWLVPLTQAANRLMAYLNDDLARLHFKGMGAAIVGTSGTTDLFDINEAANITAARTLLYAAVFLLGVAIVCWNIRIHRSFQNRHSSESPQVRTDPVEGLQAGVFDARFERLESLLARHLGEMDQRLFAVEGALRSSGEQLAHQFGDLRDRVVEGQAVNNSNFGDLAAAAASAPMPLSAVVGPGARLQDLVLNLSHLQEDLRLERRLLRKKLQDVPDASRQTGTGRAA